MKHILWVCALFICATASAQEDYGKRNAFSIGYGMVTSPAVIDGFSEILPISVNGAQANLKNRSNTGAFIMNLQAGKRRFKAGGSLAFQRITQSATDNSGNSYGTVNSSFFTIAPRVDYYWTTGFFKLYSGIALGLTFARQSYYADHQNKTFANYHLNAIGLETGGKISVYGEAGFGFGGVLNIGARCRF